MGTSIIGTVPYMFSDIHANKGKKKIKNTPVYHLEHDEYIY